MWRAGVVLCGLAGVADAGDESAQHYLDMARKLAGVGNCAEALQLRPAIERLDASLLAQFDNDPFIALCISGVQIPKPAPPPSEPAPAAPAASAGCSPVAPYVEPSIFVAAGTPGAGELQRIAFGLVAGGCDAAGQPDVGLRIGGTFSVRVGDLGFGPSSGAGGGAIYAAGGGELEVDVPLRASLLGLRAGVESYQGNLMTAGVRWRRGGAALAADAFFSTRTVYSPDTRSTFGGGVMIGAAYDGRPGALATGGLLAAGALVALASLAVYASGGD